MLFFCECGKSAADVSIPSIYMKANEMWKSGLDSARKGINDPTMKQ